MGGANSLTAIGLSYQVANLKEPLITVVACHANGTYRVCERKRGERLKEVVAEFKLEDHASTFARVLETGGVASSLEASIEALQDRALEILQVTLPPEAEHRRNPLPLEIARRITENFKLVGKKGLRDQILLILSDYRSHAWAGRSLRGEKERLALADFILAAP